MWFVGLLVRGNLQVVTVVSVKQTPRGRSRVVKKDPTLVTPQGCVVLHVGTGSTAPRCGVWTTTSVKKGETPPVDPVARLFLGIGPPPHVYRAQNAPVGATEIVV